MKGGENINKRWLNIAFILILFISCINVIHAEENCTNQTDGNLLSQIDNQSVYERSSDDLLTAKQGTYIDAPDEVEYDVIGKNFDVTLLSKENKAIPNAKIIISIDGESHELKTDSNGKASLQIRLDDGQYKVTTQFQGNSQYNSCSKQTLLYLNNTKVIGENLTNDEIQAILDNAKANNVILFKGDLYENVNLIIDKRLTLIGNGNTVIKSNIKEAIFEINGKNSSLSSISGFNLDSDGDAIKVKNSDYVTINNNKIASKGNGIVAENVRYLEIDSNEINNNAANGIVLAFADDCNVINNKIYSNQENGIALSKSNNIYIYYNNINKNKKNGIYASDEIDGVYYGDVATNLHIGNNEINNNAKNGVEFEKVGQNVVIDSNTINSNSFDGIYISKASNNVTITSNIINTNLENGISISDIGSNSIFYNLISYNSGSGIKFNYDYVLPKGQDIRFNVIIHNPQNEIDASETIYDHVINRLDIGENWYGGVLNLCPKVRTSNINITIKQMDVYLFNVTFYNSDDEIVSQLPSRIVTHKVNNGRSKSFVLYNGTGTFERDASDGNIIYVSVDMSTYSLVYKSDDPSFLHLEYPPYSPYIRPIEDVGKPYPNLPRPGLLEDITDDKPGDGGNDDNTGGNGGLIPGNGNGGTSNGNGISGNGNGNGQGSTTQSGNTHQKTTYGNGTAMQESGSNSNPSNNVGPTSNAPSAGEGQAAGNPSVVKKIIIDEEDIVRVTGISLILLLILLTIAFYYRDDIKEMQSKI